MNKKYTLICRNRSGNIMGKEYKVIYRNRVFIDKYRCIEHESTIMAVKISRVSGILYCYLDRFNVRAISIEDVISIEEI